MRRHRSFWTRRLRFSLTILRSTTVSACCMHNRARRRAHRSICNARLSCVRIMLRRLTTLVCSSSMGRITPGRRRSSRRASALLRALTSRISISPACTHCVMISRKRERCCRSCSGCSPRMRGPGRLWGWYSEWPRFVGRYVSRGVAGRFSEAIVGATPSFSAHVRLANVGHPSPYCMAVAKTESVPQGAKESA